MTSDILVVAVSVLAVGVLAYELAQARKQLGKAMELLAARTYPEYVSAKKVEEKPRQLTEIERARIYQEEILKDAEADPYGQYRIGPD